MIKQADLSYKPTASGNRTLNSAKSAKRDEFYTQFDDINNELKHYKTQLHGKTIFCNCDNPSESNFFKYFTLNFNVLGIKRLIATSYKKPHSVGGHLSPSGIEGLKPEGKEACVVEINEVPDQNGGSAIDLSGVEYLLKHRANTVKPLKGDGIYGAGDFRSRECVALLMRADIVVTNPPFSLFREYVAQLVEHDKKFLIIGSQNAVSCKEIFRLIKGNRIWAGVGNGGTKWFRVPDDYNTQTESCKKVENGIKYFSMGNIVWFTNMDNPKRHEKICLYKKYTPDDYPTYDNYNAIEVGKVAEIPLGYNGAMGVPITFFYKYNPEQFEILGAERDLNIPKGRCYINGKRMYARIIVRWKN